MQLKTPNGERDSFLEENTSFGTIVVRMPSPTQRLPLHLHLLKMMFGTSLRTDMAPCKET